MKKFFLFITCLIACLGLSAQDKKVAISSATATSSHEGHGADNVKDGNIETIWHTDWSSNPEFPVTFTITLSESSHVDFVRYIPRQDGSVNGCWDEVTVAYSTDASGDNFKDVGTYKLNASKNSYDLYGDYGTTCRRIRFTIQRGGSDSGKDFASAAEIEVYDCSELKATLDQYFTDNLYTELKSGVTSSEGIEDADVKALVDNLLKGAVAYKKFRVGEYKPYMTREGLRQMLGVNSYYSAYENPTGVYLKEGESCWVMVDGIGEDPVKLKIKNWLVNEKSSSYSLRNGLNYITALTEGNLFVDYYTDNYKNAPNVKVHFINAPVQGYWDYETMTADDWTTLLSNRPENDNTILLVQTKHVQLAYPVFSWKEYCPEPAQVDSLMKMYQQILWAERDMLGVEKYKIEYPNRQFSYVVKEFSGGAMAAGGEGTLTPVYSMHGVMSPKGSDLWVWGLAHEFGHTNQINPGLRWSGCIEVTNNIYSSWAELHVPNGTGYLRLEDEVMNTGEFRMRGGRMQAYFEEALRKEIPWMLHEGQDFYNETPHSEEVDGFDAEGNSTGKVTVTKRNYDHFVKLVPFWQLNLWGTKAEKCKDIIPMTIQGIRTQRSTSDFSAIYNTAGKEQINWMRLACDSAKINLLPFFEKAGMLRPINVHIDGWNIITEEMIAELKNYVAEKGYPTPTEEINYINGHNYHIYRDELELNVTGLQGEVNGDKVIIRHSVAQNAVAFETYNQNDELIRITMYGLGSDDTHSYTQVLFPSGAAYIMAVGYDGTRDVVYRTDGYVLSQENLDNNTCYTVSTESRGSWYSEDTRLNGTYEMQVTYNEEDANQQFAFLKSAKGNYYLYSVAKKKFVKTSGNYTELTECPEQIVTFLKSTGSSKADYPWVVALEGKQVGISTGYSPDVITFYNNLNDGGNMVRIKAVGSFDSSEALAKIEAYEASVKFMELQALILKYEEEVKKANTGVGRLTTSGATKISDAIATAKTITEENSDDEIDNAIQALNDAFNGAEIVLPAEGKFYRITNHEAANHVMYVNKNNGLCHKSGTVSDASDIFQFVATTGGYYLYNVARGTYLSTAKAHNGGQNYSETTSVDGATVISIASFGDGSVPQVSLTPAGGATLHADTNYGTVVGWNSLSNSKSAWYLNEVDEAEVKYTLSVTNVGWASLVLGFNATIPQGVKAYTVSSIAGDYANLSEVKGVLPANTPVLINAPEGNYNFVYTTATTTVEGNLLQGKPYNAYVEGESYILANGASGVCLYMVELNKDAQGADGTTHFLNNACKAYLPVSVVSSNTRILLFEHGDETGIDDIDAENGLAKLDEPLRIKVKAEIYDLTGRRVQNVHKGLYIINGKKGLIK